MDALISMSGNVGTDVELSQGEGWAYARFRLACTPRFLREGEWTDGETTWITVRVTNRTAHHVFQSVRKGDPVVVVGKLRTHVWRTPEGERADRLVVEASAVGHDLSRGTAVFNRAERPAGSPVSPGSPTEQEPGEGGEDQDVEAG